MLHALLDLLVVDRLWNPSCVHLQAFDEVLGSQEENGKAASALEQQLRRAQIHDSECESHLLVLACTHFTLLLSPQGIKIHYVEAGDPKKQLILFVHGFPEFWYSWRYQLKEFSKDYHVIAIDQRGYNESDKPAGISDYHIDRMVSDIHQFVKKLGKLNRSYQLSSPYQLRLRSEIKIDSHAIEASHLVFACC